MKEYFFRYFKYILLLALIYTPVFGHLDTLAIRIWDEARYAMNAYEMHHNHNYLVTYFDGKPDMWNTKPPLMIWMQVLWIKILGLGELAIRIPSAIAAFLTCMALLVVSVRYLKNFWIGFAAVIVLITSPGYIDYHASRTGDFDALLTLFTTLSCISFFLFCERRENKQLYFFFLFSALAVLTKGVSGLLFMPAIVIYSIVQKQFIPLLKNRHFYIGAVAFLIIAPGYYFLREAYNPGYLQAVWENELGGRYMNTIEAHKHPFWYYYDQLINVRLTPWYLLVPCGTVIGYFNKDERIKKLALYCTLMAVTYFLIISNAETKTEWYDVPLFPFLAMLVAVFIYFLFDLLANLKLVKNVLTVNVLPFILLFALLIGPYQNIVDKTYLPKEYPWDQEFYEPGYYLKDGIAGRINLDGQYMLYDGYNTQNLFYIKLLNDKGVRIAFKDWQKLDDGDVVFANQNNVKQYVEQNYVFQVLNISWNTVTYKIEKRK